MDSEELRRRIIEAVEAEITTFKALSAAIGKDHAYIQQFVKRGTPRELKDRDVATILQLIGEPPHSQVQEPSPDRRRGFSPFIIPGTSLVGASKDLPVYAAARGGSGHLIVTFDPVEYRKRPELLENVRNGYGLLIFGESMIPAYRPGHIALVNPNLPPARDEDVVLYHVDAQENGEAIIKHLIGFNEREWHLEQHNPPEQWREMRVDWPICHRVVGRYNTR